MTTHDMCSILTVFLGTTTWVPVYFPLIWILLASPQVIFLWCFWSSLMGTLFRGALWATSVVFMHFSLCAFVISSAVKTSTAPPSPKAQRIDMPTKSSFLITALVSTVSWEALTSFHVMHLVQFGMLDSIRPSENSSPIWCWRSMRRLISSRKGLPFWKIRKILRNNHFFTARCLEASQSTTEDIGCCDPHGARGK